MTAALRPIPWHWNGNVDDATWARGRGRALVQALVQLPYYRETDTVLAANARHVIHEGLADHQRRLTDVA